jgi:hypothetical protein
MADKNFSKIVKQDESKMLEISLLDVDSVIANYMETHLMPEVEQGGQKVKIPLLYGNAERWKSAQRDGYLKDKLGKLQLPLVMFKRNSIAPNDTMKFLKDHRVTYPTVKKYSQKHAYDRFSLLNPDFKRRFEAYDVRMPNYVTLTYEVMFWTGYTEHNNKIVEQFQYANEQYWGENDNYKFRVVVGDFDNQQDVGAGSERIIRTTCTLSVNAYLLPKRTDNVPTTQKGFSIRKVVVSNEVVLQGGDGYDLNGRLTTSLEKPLEKFGSQLLGNKVETESNDIFGDPIQTEDGNDLIAE